MEISYRFRLSDYKALASGMRPSWRRRLDTVVFWTLTVANLGLAVYLSIDDSVRTTPQFNFVIFVALLAMRFAIIPLVRRYGLRRLDIEGKQIIVRLDDDALHASQDGASSRIEWHAVKRFSQLPTHAFLWINKLQAVIIPFDAFGDSDAKDAFLKFIGTKIPLSD